MKVPLKFAWLSNNEHDEIVWYDNYQNYTKEQCLTMADICSEEYKEVDYSYSDEKFTREFYNNENTVCIK